MDLSGTWNIQLDPRDEGLAGAWYLHALAQPGAIRLPGSLQAQGFGDAPGIDSPWVGDIIAQRWFEDPRWAKHTHPEDFKFPFWLQPDKVYVGPAWYQREVEIPAEWLGQRVTLWLERPHWATRAWLDGAELQPTYPGQNLSLSAPHEYSLDNAAPGKHTLTLRVDNRMIVNVGPNAHSMSDHTQTDWNGVVGGLALRPGAPVWVEDVQVYPNAAEQSARVVIRLGNIAGQPGQVEVRLSAALYNLPAANAAAMNGAAPAPLAMQARVDPTGSTLEVTYPLGPGAQTWDEFQPALYRLEVSIAGSVARQPFQSSRSVSFGLRDLNTDGPGFRLNGRPLFLRGTLECCIFPLTGYPETDVEPWKRILRIARSYGLNHLRFHSYCPPEAAFVAADELGFYFQIECAAWANQGAAIGEGDPLDRWLYEEAERITRAYGNHPSFLLMAYGNEPGGNIVDYLTDWVNYWKARDPRHAHTSGAGWPAIDANQYHSYYNHENAPRIQGWGQGLDSRINARPPETLTDYTAQVQEAGRPIISHEIGQWCVYPNFAEISKYTGHLKAKNFEVFRESLEDHGMGDQAHDFLIASGKLQVLCYKEEVESALRSPGFGGFHLLDLHDFPGQGTALVGVLDPFWGDKGYVTGPEYARFCNALVPLARLSKRYWLPSETFHADVDFANFGPAALHGVTPEWSLLDEAGQVLRSGSLPEQDIPLGNTGPGGGPLGLGSAPLRLGSVDLPLTDLPAPRKLTFSVRLPGATNPNGNPVENSWDVWLFPAAPDTRAPAGIHVAHALDEAAAAHLAQGGKVLLLLPPAQVRTESVIGFSSVFWNTEWTGNQTPHTLGILVDPAHPVFNQFPTESHSNWQWWEPIHGAAAAQIDGLPRELRPLVQPIDTWFENRRLALLFEAKVGGGRLMVASMDLETDLESRPAVRSLRASILAYMASSAFDPRVEVSSEAIKALVK